MKSNAIVRIIIFSIVILVLLSILGVGFAANQFMARWDIPFIGSEGTASSTGTADADVVQNLSIEWAAGTITICHADVTEITLTETGSEKDDPMVWLQAGDTLKVSSVKEESFFHIGSIPSKDLLIEVPRNWSCGTLEIDTASADLAVEYMTIDKVDFDGASGEFRFTDCTVDTIEMDTASGDVSYTGRLNVLDCDAASADCEIIVTNCPRRIDMDTASGDLDLTLPDGCGFTVSMNNLSGNLTSEFEMMTTDRGSVSGDGACQIEMDAMSGDVFIHKGENLNCDH